MTGHHAIPDTTTASASNSRSDTQNSPISTSSSRYVKEGTTNAVGREAYEGGPPIMSNYPATYDPPPLEEPRHIPIPDDISLVRALNPYDKKQVDSDYMGFIIVLERLWSCFLREWLENFCRQQGPLLIRKEVVEAEVERVMRLWADKSVVVKQFPHRVEEVRDVAHVEYEWRVRCWHVGQHIEEYKTSTVLRLKKLGYLIGG
ncbi:MAG: hypothetical protein L6R42_002231 [Xanthoria sp. 1 TBL-2021]|nr:MAG: hypothetical protein L6R42_002231 [Xanthoria sp. 1 TBL-2021]